MPELVEQMYCSQQIVIPPKFPYILKKYCKSAIKTQPYDLLRWSYEYFSALAENRLPPVKLRLEYPIYSTEGGMTRGCLKVLANQLTGVNDLALAKVRKAWQGFCLDPEELKRVFCLCEVFLREESVPYLNFVAVVAGLLTKTLTHTMILLCETLTKEPDGGSASIPINDFLTMYKFLARIDASKDLKYFNGFREGETPTKELSIKEEELPSEAGQTEEESLSDEYWQEKNLQKNNVINDYVPHTTRLSAKLNMPVLGKIERSPSVERAGQIERENYLRERKGRAVPSEEVEKKLRELSGAQLASQETTTVDISKQKEERTEKKIGVEIIVINEDGVETPVQIYGEPDLPLEENTDEAIIGTEEDVEDVKDVEDVDTIGLFVTECLLEREERRKDLEQTFEEIAEIVDRFKSANYDLGVIAGRQMSTTSGEFVVADVEKEIMDYVAEQIAVLPDPASKKKKAKPEEMEMIKDILEKFLDDNMDVIAPEVEELEEEEQAIPEITIVYAVPGIGPPVEEDLIRDFENYALEACKVQADLFMPRNIRHFLCPPLEKYESFEYEPKEEVPKNVRTD